MAAMRGWRVGLPVPLTRLVGRERELAGNGAAGAGRPTGHVNPAGRQVQAGG
jgi:hypothetical protein